VQELPGARKMLLDRPDRWRQFRGLPLWQVLLSLCPLAVMTVGGLIGGAVGMGASG
jgi:hypothetical protein